MTPLFRNLVERDTVIGLLLTLAALFGSVLVDKIRTRRAEVRARRSWRADRIWAERDARNRNH